MLSFRDVGSGDELVATRLGDEDLGLARIALDLLPQAVDVGLERVRRDARVVAPDLSQEKFAGNRPLAGAVAIVDDCYLILA